jgi:hypothetical protein
MTTTLKGVVTKPKEIAEYELLNQEPYCRRAAFDDLWVLANDRPATIKVNGRDVVLKVGQLAWAIGSLARRWRWSDEKVRKFLVLLQDERLVTFETSRTTTTIEVMDYAVYNDRTGTKSVTESETDLGSETVTETVTDSVSKSEQKWEVGSGKGEMGRGNARTPVNTHIQRKPFPEAEVPGEEEFKAACLMRGIPGWFAETEFAYRSERPADRWPLGANWMTAVTSSLARWRNQGAPVTPPASRQFGGAEKNGGAGSASGRRERGEVLQLLALAKKSGSATGPLEQELAGCAT